MATDCRKIAFPHYDEIKVSSYIAVPKPPPLRDHLYTHRSIPLVEHCHPLFSKFNRGSYIRTAINRRRSWSVVCANSLAVICGVNENKDSLDPVSGSCIPEVVSSFSRGLLFFCRPSVVADFAPSIGKQLFFPFQTSSTLFLSLCLSLSRFALSMIRRR